MSCTYEADLTAYLDGELAPAARAALDAHLPACPDCRQLKAQLESTLALLQTLPDIEPARQSRAAVLARIAQGATLWERLVGVLNPGVLMPSLGVAGALALALVVNANRHAGGAPHGSLDLGQAELASNLDVVEDLDVLGLDREEDVDIVEHLDELEATP